MNKYLLFVFVGTLGCGTSPTSATCTQASSNLAALNIKARSCPSLEQPTFAALQCDVDAAACTVNDTAALKKQEACYASYVRACVTGAEATFLSEIAACNAQNATQTACASSYWRNASGFSATTFATSSSSFPPTLESGTTSTGDILLAWASSPGVTYNLYYSLTSPVTTFGATQIANVTSPYIFSQGGAQTTYYFALAPVTNGREGTLSNETYAATSAGFSSGTGLSGVVVTQTYGGYSISWPTAVDASSYVVYIGTSSALTKSNYASRVQAISSPYLFTSPQNGQNYWVSVSSIVAGVEGPLSAPVALSTAAGTSYLQPVTGLLASPGDNQVTLSWTTVAGATKYAVYQAVGNGPVNLTSTPLMVSSPPVTLSSLANSQAYAFVVVASDGVNVSAPSQTVYATTW